MRPASLLNLLLLPAAVAAPAQAPPTPKPADRPARTYALQGKPSEAVQSYEAMLALASQVEQGLKADLAAADGQDKAALQGLHSNLFATALLRLDFETAGKALARVRGLREDPTARLLTGLLTEPFIQASQAPGKDLHATYRALLSKRLAELPFKDVAVHLDRIRKGQKGASKAQILEGLRAGLDPLAKEGKLGEDAAVALLGAALNLHLLLPMRDDAVTCLEALLAAHPAEDTEGLPQPTPLATTRIAARGPFFGQPLPGDKPMLFAPEVLKAISPWASGVAFSPDGLECFLHVGDANYGRANMYHTRCVDGVWSPLESPSFAAGFTSTMEPVFSKDGQTLTFTATQGRQATNLWTVRRTATGWGTPVALPAPLNSDLNEFRGSWAADGTFYFGSERASPGINQVFRARPDAAGAWVVEKLGAPVNALSFDGDPCIAPDGRFLVYYAGRANGHGRVDLYITFADGKGGWGAPLNLGPQYNGPDDEFGAHLSPDGRQLFFNRHTAQGDQLYWVAVSALDRLRP